MLFSKQHSKLWVIRDIKSLLNENRAFNDGDEEEVKQVWRELKVRI